MCFCHLFSPGRYNIINLYNVSFSAFLHRQRFLQDFYDIYQVSLLFPMTKYRATLSAFLQPPQEGANSINMSFCSDHQQNSSSVTVLSWL
ncbi:hypothetical protein GDO81_014409 [Engystomops pustulosus]|uniref:Uncharacterized protein n=1 Tax=Engystomops pustulosus TaxID=76066 RepID=A0AAV7BA68_ENGPU|nr:hypothetical protein GDO81_014409 [Engystomops pustulosus]